MPRKKLYKLTLSCVEHLYFRTEVVIAAPNKKAAQAFAEEHLLDRDWSQDDDGSSGFTDESVSEIAPATPDDGEADYDVDKPPAPVE